MFWLVFQIGTSTGKYSHVTTAFFFFFLVLECTFKEPLCDSQIYVIKKSTSVRNNAKVNLIFIYSILDLILLHTQQKSIFFFFKYQQKFISANLRVILSCNVNDSSKSQQNCSRRQNSLQKYFVLLSARLNCCYMPSLYLFLCYFLHCHMRQD